MEGENKDNTVLSVVVSLLWKHMLVMSLIVITIMIVVVVTTIRQTPIYEVVSSVLVKYGREYVYRSVEQFERGDVAPLMNYDYSAIINTEIEIFKSNELAQEVILSIGVEKIFPNLMQKVSDEAAQLPLAVASFGGMLNVSHIKGSNVVSVAFQHQDPQLAVVVVSDLIEQFKAMHLEIFKNPQVAFLEQQVASSHDKLRLAEEEERQFKKKHNILDLVEQRKVYMYQYTELTTLLISENGNLDDLRAKRNYLSEQLEVMPEDVVLHQDTDYRGNVEFVESKLLQLRLEESELLQKYPESNRLVIAIRHEIKIAEEFLEKITTTIIERSRSGKNQLFSRLQEEIIKIHAAFEGKKENIASIQLQADRLKTELQALSGQEIYLSRLTKKVSSAERKYKNFRDNLDESRVQEIMDSEKLVNVVVIDKPRVPLKPIKPNKKLRVLVGFILAIASSLFYVLYREYTPEARKRLSVVLG